jgi:hypothetical protein
MIKIDKNRFSKFVQFSKNIEDRMIDNHVKDAVFFDFQPKLPKELYNAIQLFSNEKFDAWGFKTNYVIGDNVTIDEYVYQAIADNDDSKPPSSDWNKLDISEAWTEYIEPYLVFSFYGRFLLWQGNNVTQFGIRNPFEDTSTPIDAQTRSQLIADTKRKSAVYWNRFIVHLKDKNYTLDGVKYDFDKCGKSSENKSSVKMFRV